MGERARIAQFFAPLAAAEPGSFSLTDDAAVLTPPAGTQLVVTTDSVIEGIHLLRGTMPQQFAQKLVRRNLSDLASMGAMPWRYTLNLHTPPHLPPSWFEEFAAMLQQEQEHFGMLLVGGDSTSGGDVIHATLTCFGLLDATALRRNGASIGDDLYVSGTLGDAAYALSSLQQGYAVTDELAACYYAPEPRLALGQALCSIASSAIDISDGLLADVGQLCAASGCAARIEQDRIPLSDALTALDGKWDFALSGGDDYELCFTAPLAQREAIARLAQQLALPLTRIGSMVEGSGVTLLDAQGKMLPIKHTGYEHT